MWIVVVRRWLNSWGLNFIYEGTRKHVTCTTLPIYARMIERVGVLWQNLFYCQIFNYYFPLDMNSISCYLTHLIKCTINVDDIVPFKTRLASMCLLNTRSLWITPFHLQYGIKLDIGKVTELRHKYEVSSVMLWFMWIVVVRCWLRSWGLHFVYEGTRKRVECTTLPVHAWSSEWESYVVLN